ncbi:hypothetical protein ACFQ4C_25645 [Larkinella insperata]|uniref:Guanylate cyclase domain-containing protein n=1 Tax=Larkinella insperata TaxID=332158 RepID=A0ABW3QDF8_9BACT|nr:hypothetical protein [Larkinella insperata]
MERQENPIDYNLRKIAECNKELKHLSANPDEANQEVNAPNYEGFTITYKNKVELDRGRYVSQLRRWLEPYNIGVLSSVPVSTNRAGLKYIAFLDILGFSDIVENNTQEELDTFVDFLIRDIQNSMVSTEVGKTKMRLSHYGFTPDLYEAKLNSLLLSDTLIFWSNDDSEESFHEIVKTVSFLMNFEAYYSHVALRGAITVGELSFVDYRITHPLLMVDQSTIYGKAIVEAYRIEKEQQWMGCVVTQRALGHYMTQQSSQERTDSLLADYLIEYEVPYKAESRKEYVVKWPRTWLHDNYRSDIEKCFTERQKLKQLPQKDDVLLKHENTLRFVEYVGNQTDREKIDDNSI